jgi:heat shock protein beta-11
VALAPTAILVGRITMRFPLLSRGRCAVKKFVLEYCDGDSPDKFKPVFDVELADKNQRLQTEVHQVTFQAKFLKFTIGSGWGDFASVHRVSVF